MRIFNLNSRLYIYIYGERERERERERYVNGCGGGWWGLNPKD